MTSPIADWGLDAPTDAPVVERMALAAAEVAGLLGVSLRHLRALDASGRLPRPVRLGRAVRWNRAELAAWLDAGCPPRAEWQARRAGGAK